MGNNIFIRKVQIGDMEEVFNLSSQEYVRKYSINPEQINWETHVRWFNNTIKQKDGVFYVVVDEEDRFLGQIRYKIDINLAVVSISLSHLIMGKGYSRSLLLESIEKLFKDRTEVNGIIAYISKENIASVRLFEGVGFFFLEDNEDLLKYIYFRRSSQMKIGSFGIGDKNRAFIIAELSANHGNDINIAKETIKAAKDAGADAIKIQTYTADTLTIDCENNYFKLDSGTIWDGRTLYDLYKEAFTPWEWQKGLMEYANKLGLIFFSTPFDKTAVDFLEELKVPAYKVASFEIVDIPLIEYIASKGKPIIISTGIATLNDIEKALEACKRMGNNQIILLKCTSSYPAKVEDANLKTIPNMKETFGVEVGVSDHTLGTTVPVISIALGATVIEKHFILDKSIGGPDASFSLDPEEFRQMVDAVREAEKALGKIDYSMTEIKRKNRLLKRSLFVIKDINAGEVLTEENIKSIRPGYGLSPAYFENVIGKNARHDIKRGTPLAWDDIE